MMGFTEDEELIPIDEETISMSLSSPLQLVSLSESVDVLSKGTLAGAGAGKRLGKYLAGFKIWAGSL